MIAPITGWSEIAQCEGKRMIPIASLVKTTWLSRYPRTIEITYDQGRGFIGHKFIKFLTYIEHRITDKPITLGNPMSNAVLRRIHQVLGKLVRTFNIST